MKIIAWGWFVLCAFNGVTSAFTWFSLTPGFFGGLGAAIGGLITSLLIGCIGFVLAWVAGKYKSKIVAKAKSERTEIAEIVGNNKFIHIENNTVVALNTDKKELLLGQTGLMKSYPYADVREWTVQSESAGTVVGYGFTGALAAAGANAGAAKRAASNTGLFVRVRDIDNPEWRVSMTKKDDRNRWFEILTQEINEGGVAA